MNAREELEIRERLATGGVSPAEELQLREKLAQTAPVGMGELGRGAGFRDAFAIRHGTRLPSEQDPKTEGKLARVRQRLSFTRDRDEANQAVILEEFPDATFSKDAEGNTLVSIPSAGIENTFINEPGFSGRDVDQLAVSTAMAAAPAARVAKIASGFGRVLGSGAVAAADSATQDVITEATTEADTGGVQQGDAALAFSLGGLFEAAGPKIANLIGRMFQRSNGEITQPIRQMLERAGVDPADVTPEQVRALQQIGDFSPERVNDILGRDLGAEFNIRLQKSARTGSIEDQAREARLRQKYPQEFEEFDRLQAEDVVQAPRDIQARMSPQNTPTIATENQGGAVVRQGLENRMAQLEGQINRAYSPLESAEAYLDAGSFRNFINQQQEIIRPANRLKLGERTVPVTTDLLEAMDELASKIDEQFANPANRSVEIPIQEIEEFRRGINDYINGAKPGTTDFRKLNQIKGNFDRFLDDAVENSLLSGADAGTVVAQLKEARGLRAKLTANFAQRDARDGAGKIIERIVKENPDDAAMVDYLFGRAQLGGKQGSAAVVRRIIETTGRDSAETQALREMALLRLFRPKGTGRVFDRAVFIRDWNEAFTGSGAPIMDALFTTDEKAMLNRFRLLIGRTLPKELARGGPRFAARIEEALDRQISRLAQGAVLRGKPAQGGAIIYLKSLIESGRVRRALEGNLPRGEDTLLTQALRATALGASTKESAQGDVTDAASQARRRLQSAIAPE